MGSSDFILQAFRAGEIMFRYGRHRGYVGQRARLLRIEFPDLSGPGQGWVCNRLVFLFAEFR